MPRRSREHECECVRRNSERECYALPKDGHTRNGAAQKTLCMAADEGNPEKDHEGDNGETAEDKLDFNRGRNRG
jgi:hypothetical protein